MKKGKTPKSAGNKSMKAHIETGFLRLQQKKKEIKINPPIDIRKKFT